MRGGPATRRQSLGSSVLMMILVSSAIVSAISVAPPFQAQSVHALGTITKVIDDSAFINNLSVTTSDPGGDGDIYVAWNRPDDITSNGTIFISKSTDGGFTFSPAINLSSNPNVDSSHPYVVASGNDVYVTWDEPRDIYFTKSTDGGSTFSTPLSISNSTSFVGQAGIAIAGAALYIVYYDFDPILGQNDIYLLKSTDGGDSWGSPINVSNTVTSSFSPRMAAISNDVYIVWEEDEASASRVFFSKSTDGGATFGSPIPIDEDVNVDSIAPYIALSGSELYITWLQIDKVTGDKVILSKSSIDGGATFGSIVTVSDTESFSEPKVATVPSTGDKVYVSWESSGIFFSRSRDLGSNFGDNVQLNPAFTYSNDMTMSDNAVYVVWADSSGISLNIFAIDNPPVADPGFEQDVVAGDTVILDGTASFDPDGDPVLTYSWNQVSGPTVTLSDSSSATPSFVAPDVGNITTLEFELIVNSTDGSDLNTVDVFVNSMTGITNLSNNTGFSSVPNIVASNSSNLYAIWQDDTPGNSDIFFARSTDAGNTWDTTINISNNPDDSFVPYAAVADPDGNGIDNVYAVWDQSIFTTGAEPTIINSEVFVARSLDGGLSFENPVNVTNNADFSASPYIAAAGNNVYLVYSEEPENGIGNSTIFFTKSNDAGITWTVPFNVSRSQGDAFVPYIAVSGNNLYAVWHALNASSSATGSIFFAASTDNGDSWSAPIIISDSGFSNPHIAVSVVGTSIYVVWENEVGLEGHYDIFFAKSNDSGTTWSTSVNVSNNTGHSSSPYLAVMSSNKVLVVWSDNTDTLNGHPDVFFSRSVDGGATWMIQSNVSQNTGHSTWPEIATLDNDAFVVWGDTSAGNEEIFFKKISSNVAPVSNAGIDQSVDEGDLVTLNGTGSNDADSDSLTYSWTQTAGPAVTLSNPNVANPTFTAPTITSDVMLTFELTVNDGTSNSTPDTVNVSVNDLEGTLTIRKVDQDKPATLLNGSAFRITPNPFTLSGSLTVKDNGIDDFDPTDGVIQISGAEFGTFLIEETQVPAGYTRIVQNVTVSIHSTQHEPVVTIGNKLVGTPVTGVVEVRQPDLNSTAFNTFIINNATVGGVLVDDVHDLPPALLVSSLNQVVTFPPVTTFNTAIPATTNAQQIISTFSIPTYSVPEPQLLQNNFYVVPPVLVKQEGSANNFLLTPVLDKTTSGMTLILDHATPIASGNATVKQVQIKFSDLGAANDVAFSFGITDTVPPGAPTPPQNLLGTAAFYLDVDFTGDFGSSPVSFSSSTAFDSPPKIKTLIKRNLEVPKLADGCPDVNLYLLNEAVNPAIWTVLNKPTREPTLDNAQECGYSVQPDHFSKFAVGGVKITANFLVPGVIDDSNNPGSTPSTSTSGGGSGGGNSRSSSLSGAASSSTQVSEGSDGTVTVSVQSSGSASYDIGLQFKSVQAGGQVKVTQPTLSTLANLFDSIGSNQASVTLFGSRYDTVGPVFDIDASQVTFSGTVDVTVAYDESMIQEPASELDVRFLHYDGNGWQDNTISVDTGANTVTGRVSSLSPVVAAISSNSTFAPAYFELNPLNKVGIMNTTFLAAGGNKIITTSEEIKEGQQIVVSNTIKNYQTANQTYAVILQILHPKGYVQSLSWQTGVLQAGKSMQVSNSWTSSEQGTYTVEIFVLNDIYDNNAYPLSTPTLQKIIVVS